MVGRARWGFRCKDGSVRLVELFHTDGTVTLLRYEGDEAMWSRLQLSVASVPD